MKVKIYTVGKTKLIGEYNAGLVFEPSFWHRQVPSLSKEKCRKILDAVSPNYKLHSETFVIENPGTGHCHVQKIYRGGTLLDF